MEHKLVPAQDHEIECLARKHGTTVEKVKEIIKQTGSRSRKQLEEALDKPVPARSEERARGTVLTHRDLTLLTTRSRPFSCPDWLYELKWDGYRVVALDDDAVRLL
jgi:hypothetical protein